MKGILLNAAVLCCSVLSLHGQNADRIGFNDQDLFLSGANIAWINFARDIGPGNTRLDLFEEMFREMNEHGGNSFRIWLHTNGVTTPQFSGTGENATVSGPGAGAIDDLRDILDLAHYHDIGLQLCLWSFDMLQQGLSTDQLARNRALLTDDEKTEAYIANALIPMVDALKGHPALLAWEIFNEPEGMTTQFGWTPAAWRISMSDVQRFVNKTAGAIRRTDPNALITNGSWSFRASSDVRPEGVTGTFQNYYRDDRLIAAGGDSAGVLDFYSIHYYKHFQQALSPFSRDASFWNLDRPIVIGEFYLNDPRVDGNANTIFGVHWTILYESLYNRGYAGAMGWQWFDWYANRTNIDGVDGTLQWPNMLFNMQSLYEKYRDDVELLLPGLRGFISAFPEGIEAGSVSRLEWEVRGNPVALTVNGNPVEPRGALYVSPLVTTTYTLFAEDADGDTAEWEVTVTVLDPSQVNRALLKPVYVSSEQDEVPGETTPARYANDGDNNTRWSSKWRDNQYIFIDMELSYAVAKIVLNWEDAYARYYNIDVSFDGVNWATVHEEREGEAGPDTLLFETPVDARFVRMHGILRGTEWGFSLYEFEVYGLPSEQQPPKISIISPAESTYLEVKVSFSINAGVEAGDIDTMRVDFFIDEEHIGTKTDSPYSVDWKPQLEGSYILHAVVSDGHFTISSFPREITVSPKADSIRLEAETAVRRGDVQVLNEDGASGGSFIRMRDASEITSSLTWDNIHINDSGVYGLRIGFRLPFDDPKGQHIDINGVRAYEEIMFTGPLNQWLTLDLTAEFISGSNTVTIEGYWGWMDFDYIEIRGQNLLPPVSMSGDEYVAYQYALFQNYPNPFNPFTVISYSVAEPAHVELVVYDITGRRVAVLIDESLNAGRYTAVFDAARFASGTYYYRLRAGDYIDTKRMLLIK